MYHNGTAVWREVVGKVTMPRHWESWEDIGLSSEELDTELEGDLLNMVNSMVPSVKQNRKKKTPREFSII